MQDLSLLLSCGQNKLQSIMRFNFLPASYIHQLKRKDFLPEMPCSVWEAPQAYKSLSTIILDRIGLPDPFIDPDHPSWRIALMSGDQLMKLARYVGAVLMLNKIRSSLSRDAVLSWKQIIGNDAYDYALSSASLLPRIDLEECDCSAISPDVAGYRLLECAIATMPDPVAIRLKLKIPPLLDSSDINSVKALRLVFAVLDNARKEWSL